MSDKPDFACEYAKSGRSGCKLCKLNIGMSSLRMAIYVQVFFLKLICSQNLFFNLLRVLFLTEK